MARLGRLTLGGVVHHVAQSGNNRQAVFADGEDYTAFLAALRDAAVRSEVAIHAYALLENRFEMLLTPKGERGLPTLMQALGRRYVRHFNDRHARSGTLWEGRYRSALVEAEQFLLPCMAYVDLVPVRSGAATRAIDHRWSSHAHYTGLHADPILTPHPLVWQLGNTPFAREETYGNLVRDGLDPVVERRIESALRGNWALGDDSFVASVAEMTQRRAAPGKAGRPRTAA